MSGCPLTSVIEMRQAVSTGSMRDGERGRAALGGVGKKDLEPVGRPPEAGELPTVGELQAAPMAGEHIRVGVTIRRALPVELPVAEELQRRTAQVGSAKVHHAIFGGDVPLTTRKQEHEEKPSHSSHPTTRISRR